VLDQRERLLTTINSNGVIPGEAAGAILVTRPSDDARLTCRGIGFGREHAPIDAEQPFKGDGLVDALRAALADAGCSMHDLDFRITDIAGEQYYFKEAALALTRVLRARKDAFDLWHAAECIGEVGAAAGLVAIVVAEAACRKAYAPGPGLMFHAGNDAGERTAAVFSYAS
jgi:3-oxoacyl-[acyl-carrier-protein] synthase-1